MQPTKHWIEQKCRDIFYTYPEVYHVILLSNPLDKEYTLRVCVDGYGAFEATDKQWNYHKMIEDMERLCDETCKSEM
ncbi:hypothetical protein NVP1084O_149 [Vibrio phage 1.084.O._10N.261.49.F5]|nr:hypothetical protein NVP1084O_149 [Vibrio phage 1.084.O._10N.261.49.F5]